MLRAAFVATALALVAMPAFAEGDYNPIEGIYQGSGEGDLEVNLTHIEADRYSIAISTTVPMENNIPGCGGGIDGEVLLDEGGGNFFVENEGYIGTEPESLYNQRYCEISLKLDGNGELVIEEQSGCGYYHGASCGFTGTLTHDAAGI